MKVNKLNENFELIESEEAAENQISKSTITADSETIEAALEEAYQGSVGAAPVNVTFNCEQGRGSAASVKRWATKKGLNVVYIDATVFDPKDSSILKLNEKKSILVIDDYKRCVGAAKAALAMIADRRKLGSDMFTKLIFTVFLNHTGVNDDSVTKMFKTKADQTDEGTDIKTDAIDEQATRDYREFANIDESVEITADNIDEWALNEAAVKNNIQSYDLKHVLLKEEKTIDQAGRELEAEVARAESQNQVDKVLDRSLKIAKRKQRSGDTGDFPNILLVSDAGFGKTDMVRQWAKKNGINLVQKNLGTMGPEAFGGIVARDADDPRYATRLGTNEMIKALEKPNSVLFLDEYNRSKTEVRGAVLTLVQNHMVWDPTEENQEKFLENFLFTVAAINPPNAAYKGAKEMDPAEKSRFYSVNMQPDPMEHLKYLRSFYTEKIEGAEDEEEKLEYRRKLALAEKILTSPRFTYDGPVDIEENQDDPSFKPLNYRSFKMALDYCDGTKDDFIDVWNHYCNPKKKRIIEDILGDYVDIDDKANDALKDDSESSVFKQEMGARAKLKKAFAELNI